MDSTQDAAKDQSEAKTKKRRGRPTSYKPEYCQMIMDHMYDGGSVIEFAREIKVAVSSIYVWAEKNEEFSDALKKGKDFSKGWWMSKGREALHVKGFNHGLWYMNMKNRFGWTDNQNIEHSVNPDKNSIEIGVVLRHANPKEN